jgi:hypothetical protein
MVIAGIDPDPGKAAEITKWAKDYWAAVHPFDLEGAYPNFMMDDEGEERIKASYGGNYPRLAALKEKFDPTNLFHINQNIRPVMRATPARRDEIRRGEIETAKVSATSLGG